MIQIVDENDQLVGHKDRSEIDHKNDIYRATALWVSNSQGEVLIAQRKLTKENDPGKWGPAVSGTVDESETYKDNVYKEAEEEIGLVDEAFKEGPKIRVTNSTNFFCQCFSAKLDKEIEEFRLQKEEVEQVKWLSIDELERDVSDKANKYVPTMPQILKAFRN